MQKLKRAFEVIFIERRLPYSWASFIQSTLYEKSFKKCLKGVENTPPTPCQPKSPTELHLVTCQKDTHMAVLAIKSLLRFIPNLAVIIHGDESLDDESISIIQNAIPGTKVITYDDANRLAKEHLDAAEVRSKLPEIFQLDSTFEKQKKAWALKIFDFHLFSNSQKVIVLDSDTLFLKKPDEIIEWIESASSLPFYATPGESNLWVDEHDYRNAFPEARIIESFNGGLFGFDKSTLPLDKLISIAKTLINHPEIEIYGDECVWRFAYSHIESQNLPYETYPLFKTKKCYKQLSASENRLKYMHFLLKYKEGLYKKIASRVLLELGHSEVKKP